MLLALYGNFFPTFMASKHFWMAPAELEKAAKSIAKPKNAHRLEALPAVAAAQAIPFTPDVRKEELWERISRALTIKNREIREIVLQNLITASLPSPDEWRVNQTVLNGVVNVIDEAKHIPELLSPASLALTFLLNTRAMLCHKRLAVVGNGSPTLVDRHITQALSCRAGHFFYLKQLKTAHEEAFGNYDPHDVSSLPSHSTEMIVQSYGARRNTPSYNLRLALLHARTTFEVWRTANGLTGGVDAVMTKSQAERAFPKLIEFQAATGMQRLLPTFSQLALPPAERAFQKFISDELNPTLSNFDKDSNPQCRQLEAAGRLPRPISGYRSQAIADRVGATRLQEIGNLALETVQIVTGGVAADRLVHYQGVEATSQEAFDLPSTPSISSARMKQIAKALVNVDEETGEALDDVEREIGPARVRSDPH